MTSRALNLTRPLLQTSFYNFQTINEKKQGIQQNIPTINVNKITLRYTLEELEKSFLDDYIRSSVQKVRLGLLLVLLFEVFVGLLDLTKIGTLSRHTVTYLLAIRYAGVTTLLGLLGGFTFTRWFPLYMQASISLTTFLCCILLFIQLCLTVNETSSVFSYGVYYLTHTVFLLVYQFSWSRLLFPFTVGTFLCFIMVYVVVVSVILPDIQGTLTVLAVLIIVSAMLCVACYSAESFIRKRWILKLIVSY